MVGVHLDARGRLIRLDAVPPQQNQEVDEARPPDWSLLFIAAGMEMSEFAPVEPTWSPLTFADDRRAWEGAYPDAPGTTIRIEAASYRDRPVFFRIINKWTQLDRMETPKQNAGETATAVAYAATRGLMTWLLYVAIEPFIRQLHPRSMVSWSRLLAGRFTDPAVGRDVLFGLAVISLQNAAIGVWSWAQGLRGTLLPLWAFGGQNPMVTSVSFSTILRQSVVGVGSALGFLLISVVLRRLAKGSRWLAPLLLWFLFLGYSLIGFTTGLGPVDLVAYGVIYATGSAYLAVRHGLLAFVVNIFISQVAIFTIFTVNPADWYFPSSAIFVVLVVGLTAFGVRVSANRAELTSSG